MEATKPRRAPKVKDQPAFATLPARFRASSAEILGLGIAPGLGMSTPPGCAALEATLAALFTSRPKVPDTPLANSQELMARVVAQRIAPFNSAVLRFIGPQVRLVIQPPINKEINKLIMLQIPTAVPTSPAVERGAPEPDKLDRPIAAPRALSTNWLAKAVNKPAKIGPQRTRSWYSATGP